ncbi:unnamed protein product [Oikopleura dioica]|uniref:Uncharacterized protein n=1 Tax=Oikopleura dioica TaxID=34765 RepID=E4X7X4_OIKDI|nr:unnamed protein product [Oikopleura dioica]
MIDTDSNAPPKSSETGSSDSLRVDQNDAFLHEPDSAESQAELLEAAVEINEVNFVKNIVAPDSSIAETSATSPESSVESLFKAFSDLDVAESEKSEEKAASLPDQSAQEMARGKRTYPGQSTDSEKEEATGQGNPSRKPKRKVPKNDLRRKLSKIERNFTDTAEAARQTLESQYREQNYGRRGGGRPRSLGITKKVRYACGTVRKFIKFGRNRNWTPIAGPVDGFNWTTSSDSSPYEDRTGPARRGRPTKNFREDYFRKDSQKPAAADSKPKPRVDMTQIAQRGPNIAGLTFVDNPDLTRRVPDQENQAGSSGLNQHQRPRQQLLERREPTPRVLRDLPDLEVGDDDTLLIIDEGSTGSPEQPQRHDTHELIPEVSFQATLDGEKRTAKNAQKKLAAEGKALSDMIAREETVPADQSPLHREEQDQPERQQRSALKPLREKTNIKFPENIPNFDEVKVVNELERIEVDLANLMQGVTPRNEYSHNGRPVELKRSRSRTSFSNSIMVHVYEKVRVEEKDLQKNLKAAEEVPEMEKIGMRTYPYVFDKKTEAAKKSKGAKSFDRRYNKLPSFRARRNFLIIGISEENLVDRSDINVNLTEAQQSVIFKALYDMSAMRPSAMEHAQVIWEMLKNDPNGVSQHMADLTLRYGELRRPFIWRMLAKFIKTLENPGKLPSCARDFYPRDSEPS